MTNGPNRVIGDISLRDGWIVTGWVLVPPPLTSMSVAVHIDRRLVGYAVATTSMGGATEEGLDRLEYDYVPRSLWVHGTVHLLECFDPEGTLIGRLSTTLQQAKPYNSPSEFLAWAYYHRILHGPFTQNDEICLSYFDWYATHCAVEAATKPRLPVSIVMPCWNSADTLPRAIESVLAQDHPAWQLIVVDDGSDTPLDDVQTRFQDRRITFLRLPSNQGQAAARNTALSMAQGELITFLDADNYWDSRFLSVMAAALETHRQRDMAYCGQYLRDEECRPIAVRMGDYNPTLIENENYIDLNCAMIRKEALDRCGGFDISCRAFEDWELFLRLVEEKAPLFVPVVLSHYTCGRPTSISQSDRIGPEWTKLMETRRSRAGVQTFTAEIDGRSESFWSRPEPRNAPNQKVSIIIPSFNIAPILRVCLEQVFATVNAEHTEVIVCDNGSDDETQTVLADFEGRYAAFRVDRADRNYGFTHAVNRGLRLASPDNEIVILNNDAIVTAGWLDTLLAVRARNPDAGVIAPRQVLLPWTQTISHHTPYANPYCEIDVTVSAHHRNVDSRAPVQLDGTVDLTFVPFFCVLITRNALEAIGTLDERLGRHYRSDSIFCFAVRAVAGLRILFAPRSKVYHLLQKSTHALQRSDADGFRQIFLANRWAGKESGHAALPWEPWS